MSLNLAHPGIFITMAKAGSFFSVVLIILKSYLAFFLSCICWRHTSPCEDVREDRESVIQGTRDTIMAAAVGCGWLFMSLSCVPSSVGFRCYSCVVSQSGAWTGSITCATDEHSSKQFPYCRDARVG